MIITNETCYSTEDLLALFKRVKETYELCKIRLEQKIDQNGPGPPYSYRANLTVRVPPAELRVGYYQPSTPETYRSYKFLNSGGNARLGIVKRTALDINALVALAEAADGAGLTLPVEVVKELVTFFLNLIGVSYGTVPWKTNRWGNTTNCDYSDLWAWVDTFKVSYRMRAKRGSKAKVRRAREVAKLSHLKDTLQYKENEVTCCEMRLRCAKSSLSSHKKQITDLSKKLGV